MDEKRIVAKVADMKTKAVKDAMNNGGVIGFCHDGNFALNFPIECQVKIKPDGSRAFTWYYDGKRSNVTAVKAHFRSRP